MKSKNTQNSIYKVQSLERALDIPDCFNIDKREGDGMLRISSDIGWRRPLHYGMLGMVLMASLTINDMKQILSEDPLLAHTPFSITDQDAFSLRMERIRDQGYVLEKEEAVEGVIGIAAPIKDYTRLSSLPWALHCPWVNVI